MKAWLPKHNPFSVKITKKMCKSLHVESVYIIILWYYGWCYCAWTMIFPYLERVPECESEGAGCLVDGVVAGDSSTKHDHVYECQKTLPVIHLLQQSPGEGGGGKWMKGRYLFRDQSLRHYTEVSKVVLWEHIANALFELLIFFIVVEVAHLRQLRKTNLSVLVIRDISSLWTLNQFIKRSHDIKHVLSSNTDFFYFI